MDRVGMGYDSHRFSPSRRLVLGGVELAPTGGLTGHSDADALLHAVTDAVLGAIAAGDIGELFPDTDSRWANADSRQFLRAAVDLAGQRGYSVVNCDVTILAERPRLSEHKPAIQASLAKLLGVQADCVGVKAKTNERMGFVGRGSGIAVLAIVGLARRKDDAAAPSGPPGGR